MGAMRALGLGPVTPPESPPPPAPPVPAGQPFADDFNQADAPTLSGFWATRLGAVGIANQEAVSRSAGASIATLNGVTVVDSVSQAFFNLRTARSVGLVARYSGRGDTNMYVAAIQPYGTAFVGRIWLNRGGVWRILAAGQLASAAGVMRFEVAGSSLTLLFNGVRVTGAFDRAIAGPGGVGIRMLAAGATVDNYSQDTLVPPTPSNAGLPFSDAFGVNGDGDSPYLPGSWTKRVGNLAIASGVVVNRLNGVSVMAVNGVSARDSRTQAFVNVVNGASVSLVARYTGAGDARMYAAGLARSGAGFVGRIWLNRGYGWLLLASGASPGGSGTLRFDVVGSALTLFLNGRKIAAASNRVLTTAGTVGIRYYGAGCVADNFSATALTPPAPTTVTSPFSDAFVRPDSPYLSSSWAQPFGNLRLEGETVVSQIDGASITTLYGVTARDSSTQAVVNIGGGSAAGLVARYRGGTDSCMYLAGLVRKADGYFAGIWLNNGLRWSTLASTRVPGGSGRIRFDCIGSSLALFLNGGKLLAVRDATLGRAGAVGLRLMGDGCRVDSCAYERR